MENWISVVLAFVSIILTLCIYFKHDRNIKKQDFKLNKLLIKKYEEDEAKEKMADIKVNIIREHMSAAKIRFVNVGKADAQNVRIEILSAKEELSKMFLSNILGPYQIINSKSYREEFVALYKGLPDIIELKVIWDDEFGKNRSARITVSL